MGIKKQIKTCVGIYYGLLHLVITVTCCTVLLFDNNVLHLIIMFNLLAVDALTCVLLKNCPLTILENKYLKKTWITERMTLLRDFSIDYQCNHQYESTLEILINIGALFILKLAVLLLL
jgi:hypothetical protein